MHVLSVVLGTHRRAIVCVLDGCDCCQWRRRRHITQHNNNNCGQMYMYTQNRTLNRLTEWVNRKLSSPTYSSMAYGIILYDLYGPQDAKTLNKSRTKERVNARDTLTHTHRRRNERTNQMWRRETNEESERQRMDRRKMSMIRYVGHWAVAKPQKQIYYNNNKW